jgi:hypothetical protein
MAGPLNVACCIAGLWKVPGGEVLMRILLITVAVVALSAAHSHAACNLRCPNDGGSVIVCDGDGKFETITKCGEPDFVEDVGYISAGRFGSIMNGPSHRGAYRESMVKVERWYYNCGEGRFIKEVVFKGGKVVSIENLPDRGSGPQKCW